MRVAWIAALALSAAAGAQEGVVATKHNLSATGPGRIKARAETQICIFCHVAHGGEALGMNRPLSQATYRPYASATLRAQPGAPSGATKICLSCHDGTIALGQTIASGRIAMAHASPEGTLPEGPSHLGTDLRKTHPVSFAPAASPEVHAPPPGDAVRLDRQGRVQCTSCHDPHRDDIDATEKKFLVKPNRASALCLTCHAERYWSANPSAHQRSQASYDRSLGATTARTTVADNGCESCHRPHGAAVGTPLLDAADPQICLRCHGGQVGRADVRADLAKPHAHPVLSADPTLHAASEGPSRGASPLPERRASQPRHVVCVDCHDPHAAYAQAAKAPRASGALAGVWGIDRDGLRVEPARYEYEVCFKCHADSANQPRARGPRPPETLRRAVTDTNLRRVFDLAAPSFHPVEGPGRNPDVPGLIAPLSPASVIYCSDCHASNTGPGAGGGGARGPHGSSYRHLLERNLATADRTVESPAAYALCYKCHDRAMLLDPKKSAFPLHRKHVVDDALPCTACHDPHGVSAMQGSAIENAHLINFDVSIVGANSRGQRVYRTTTPGRGRCSLACHGADHVDSRYERDGR